MATADHCEMFVIIYENTWCHFPEEGSLKENELFMLALYLPLQGKAS
jgi:hypothetical protein